MLYVNFSVKCPKFAPKWPLYYFQPILVSIYATIATVKVKLIPDFYTLTIVLIYKQVAQWATIAHHGASIMFGDTIYDAQRQITLNLKQ